VSGLRQCHAIDHVVSGLAPPTNHDVLLYELHQSGQRFIGTQELQSKKAGRVEDCYSQFLQQVSALRMA